MLIWMCLFDLKQCFSNFSVHPNDVEALLRAQIAGACPVSDAWVLRLGIGLSDKFPAAAHAAVVYTLGETPLESVLKSL